MHTLNAVTECLPSSTKLVLDASYPNTPNMGVWRRITGMEEGNVSLKSGSFLLTEDQLIHPPLSTVHNQNWTCGRGVWLFRIFRHASSGEGMGAVEGVTGPNVEALIGAVFNFSGQPVEGGPFIPSPTPSSTMHCGAL